MTIKYSKETINFVDHIVDLYCHYNKLDDQYILSPNNIDFSDLSKLTSLIMLDDEDYAIECTSIENPAYKQYMLPTLIGHIHGNINDQDFSETWHQGILEYQMDRIFILIDERLKIYNQDKAA